MSVSVWDEAATTLEGARAAAWAEPPEAYWPRAYECADVILALLGDVEDRVVPRVDALDLGCGPGRLLVAMSARRPRWILTGADSSEAMCRWALDEAWSRGCMAAVVPRDVTALTEQWADRFDLAWSVAVLQHLEPERQEAAIGEIGRVLRCGGRAVVQVVEGDTHAPLCHDLDADTLRGWADEAGLAIVIEGRGQVQPNWLWAVLERR